MKGKIIQGKEKNEKKIGRSKEIDEIKQHRKSVNE